MTRVPARKYAQVAAIVRDQIADGTSDFPSSKRANWG
jgi:hypothetical protein